MCTTVTPDRAVFAAGQKGQLPRAQLLPGAQGSSVSRLPFTSLCYASERCVARSLVKDLSVNYNYLLLSLPASAMLGPPPDLRPRPALASLRYVRSGIVICIAVLRRGRDVSGIRTHNLLYQRQST